MPWRERVARELRALAEGGQRTEVLRAAEGRDVVVYYDVTTAGAPLRLPDRADVVVPIPAGYPVMIDLAGLVAQSPLLPRLKGGTNNQGHLTVDGRVFRLASYHPHTNGGGPPWDPSIHGFHTYLDHLLAWLAIID